ncbi:MAG: hypothetical protein HY909_20535 [Deltaproteobacteria bacterium]|nr:hypothetical protein [Deltaproteobacteria bacterium]
MRMALVSTLVVLFSCSKAIGDSCTIASDCSINGDRLCDTSQPDGYCIVSGCDPGSCPDTSLCVAFNAHNPRLSRRFCMAPCAQDSDCRTPLYHCQRPDPAACRVGAPELLPAGRTCNVLLDTPDPSQGVVGWCVQGAPPAP